MRFLKFAAIFLVIVLAISFVFAKPAKVTVSTIIFLPQVFPQIPIKPLNWISSEPILNSVEFLSGSNKVTAEIYRPNDSKPKPALILAMGVRTAEHDKPVMTNFARALARIGFVTVIVNRTDLIEEKIRIEDKDTFISAYKYLANLPYVDKDKITIVGISVGSSIALKAAEDPKIASRIRALVFFGGYFDAVDYFSSLITQTVVYKDKEFSWQPHEHVANHLKEVVISLAPSKEQAVLAQVLKDGKKLKPEGFTNLSAESQFAIKAYRSKNKEEFNLLWKKAPLEIKQKFEDISPAVGIENVKTQLFILHDRGDRNVSYYQSRKLNDALPKNVKRTSVELSLFEHVQPKEGFSWPMILELLKLYPFIWQVVFFAS